MGFSFGYAKRFYTLPDRYSSVGERSNCASVCLGGVGNVPDTELLQFGGASVTLSVPGRVHYNFMGYVAV